MRDPFPPCAAQSAGTAGLVENGGLDTSELSSEVTSRPQRVQLEKPIVRLENTRPSKSGT